MNKGKLRNNVSYICQGLCVLGIKASVRYFFTPTVVLEQLHYGQYKFHFNSTAVFAAAADDDCGSDLMTIAVNDTAQVFKPLDRDQGQNLVEL